jgi:hypothetical protein
MEEQRRGMAPAKSPASPQACGVRKKKAETRRFPPKLNREASRLGDVRIRRPSSRVLQPGNLSSAEPCPTGKLMLRCKIAPSESGVRGLIYPFLISRVTSAKSAILWFGV